MAVIHFYYHFQYIKRLASTSSWDGVNFVTAPTGSMPAIGERLRKRD
jgi:hypothetical protein